VPAEQARRAETSALDRVLKGAAPRRRAGRGQAAEWSSGRDPAPVGDLVEQFIAREGWEREVSVGTLVARWEEIAGRDVAAHCVPESFREGKLVVRAESGPWASNVRLFLPQLAARIAAVVGPGIVTEITVLGPAGPASGKGRWTVRAGKRPDRER
jgi:predicted nucleic acid-binding Zn ribbon protein